MSARVFNPVVMSEMRRMLRAAGGSGTVALPENVGQAPAVVTAPHRPDGAAVGRVRRVLFGPGNHEEARQFVKQELALQQERDAERWGFDFLRERPLDSGQGSKRYVWVKVASQEKVPEPYALRGMEYISKCAVLGDDAPPTPVAATAMASTETTNTNTKQTSIPDFMKKKKRTYNAAKSAIPATSTTKKARMSNS